MPNIKSAINRVKKTRLQTSINKIRKSKYKSVVKEMSGYISANNMADAKKFLPKFQSEVMKIAKTGVINKKTASRKISRLTKKIKKKN